jgi:threonine dehydrogenase-like Zn-dependent dehydrogenase
MAWMHRPGMLPKCTAVVATEPRRDEARIRPTLVGLCGTDRGIVTGAYPGTAGIVLGHEGVGVVQSVGSGLHERLVGQRVVVNPTLWCGRCDPCRRGSTNTCEEKAAWEIGISRDGLLQKSCVLPVRALHIVPPEMPDRTAAMVEPLACVLHALGRVAVRADASALVIGGGPIGSVMALALDHRISGPLLVVESDAHRRQFLARQLGLGVTDSVDRGERYDLVVDTVGNQLEAGLASLRSGGTLLAMGCRSDSIVTIRPFEMLSRQACFVFSCDYDAAEFRPAVEAAQKLSVERVITHVLPFEQVEEAFRLLGTNSPSEAGYRAQKVVIRVN